MAVLFDDAVYVVDGTILAFAGQEAAEVAGLIDEAFAGQRQGLLGAGVASALVLQVGIQHGPVGLRVEVGDGPPPIGNAWDDAVEASFTPDEQTLNFENLDSDRLMSIQIPLRDHRVRYCGRDVDVSAQAGMLDRNSSPVESHALYFWPAPRSGDEIIKLASESGAEISRQRVDGENTASNALTNDQDSATDSSEYLAAFNSASHRQQCAAMAALIDHAARATELTDEPAVERVLNNLRNGELLPPRQRDPLVVELMVRLGEACTSDDVDEKSVRWRRLQAGEVLRDALRADMVLCMAREDDGPLDHAHNALGSHWAIAIEASLAEL